MDLPVMPPVRPMLAKLVSRLPEGMLYEPKWDASAARSSRCSSSLCDYRAMRTSSEGSPPDNHGQTRTAVSCGVEWRRR
jgi:hypothetical protein